MSQFEPRKRQRLIGYDYRQANAYFVTLNTRNREDRFGLIEDGRMRFNPAGRMVMEFWQTVSTRYPTLNVVESVLMPNHLHSLIVLLDLPPQDDQPRPSLSEVIQWFKIITTNSYIRQVHENGWPPFDRKLWHVSFNDRIIRNDDEFQQTQRYIRNNPIRRWQQIVESDGEGIV